MKFNPILVVPLVLCGCAGSSSPVALPQTTDHTSFSQGTDMVAGAAIGAAGGYAVKKDAVGAIAGAALGTVGGALVANAESNSTARREAELVEAAKREERVKLLNEYWEAERYQKAGVASTTETRDKNQINYPGGIVDGVNVAPRRSDSEEAALSEPSRP